MDRLFLATYGPPGVTRVTITEDGKIYNPDEGLEYQASHRR